jgi:hypothetical protein
MIRRLVRLLIAPLVRWAGSTGEALIGVSRNTDGVYVWVLGPFGEVADFDFTPDEAREFGQEVLLAARDAQEGAPIAESTD